MATTLPIVESFHSIQGEGAHSGRSAYFIRLANCKVGCPWCDTKDSWSSANYPYKNVEELAKEAAIAKSQGAAFLVITGGEPLHHNLTPLCKAIVAATATMDKSMPIHLETSGVDQISGSPNWITLSPKRHLPPKERLLGICQEIKVVIHEKEDIFFAEEMAKIAVDHKRKQAELNDNIYGSTAQPLLFLQPGWGNKEGHDLTIKHVIKNPKWRLSLQTHKWLNIA